jgi:hypothetical protein
MIRTLVASALPVLGVGAAIALVGPDLIAGPTGEPLRVASHEGSMLHPASFDATSCTSALLAGADDAAGTRIVAFTEDAGFVVVVETPHQVGSANETLVLIFNASGRLIAAGHPNALETDAAGAALIDDCAHQPPAGATGQI